MYFNFKNYSVDYDEKAHAFSCFYRPDEKEEERPFVKDAAVSVRSYQGELISPKDYKKVESKLQLSPGGHVLSIIYSDGPRGAPVLELHFTLDSTSLHIRTFARAIVHVEGVLIWGGDPGNSTFGVRMNAEDHNLRAACGPAFSIHDNALFDRLSDMALEFKATDRFKVRYDWKTSLYRFRFESGLDFGRNFSFKIHEDFCRRKFNIPYAPIDKRHGFKTPPVGWMSWYAVQFKADEQIVLENAKLLSSTFGKHAEKLCLWVDWEWNHKAFDGLGQEGVDTFTPRKEAYPNGLAHVAEEIEKLGLIPALWIGATNDGQQNRLLKAHPEWILANQPLWCGQWWVDPSHPEVVKEYIPAVFKQVLAWGYKAIKWDCFPSTFSICDASHPKFHNPALSTDAAMRNLVKAARKTIGTDVYMLYCACETERDITFAMDQFSAARIGGDIFGWSDFIANSIERVFRFYPWHNVVFYADGDNLVLRSEFNSLAQARSRVSFYGLTGLPVTIGDNLPELDEARIDMLKRIIPVADIHPMDLQHKVRGEGYVLVNLAVCREFGDWNVVGLMNIKDEPLELNLSLESDLHIDIRGGIRYAVYDFWKGEFLGIHGDTLQVSISPMDSAVLRITPLTSHPQVISTSRHITQGAYDLSGLRWDAVSNCLSGNSKCVEGEVCRLTLYVPEG
ncbi:MAG: alpha-galactosidase, partial [Victivallales bacterium]